MKAHLTSQVVCCIMTTRKVSTTIPTTDFYVDADEMDAIHARIYETLRN